MATLYLDTSAVLTELPSQYRMFYWQKAVVIETDSDHPLFARDMHTVWSHILGLLGHEALSMRKVCRYFTRSVFNDVYKNGPVVINTTQDRIMCLAIINSQNVNITNPTLILGPSLASDRDAFFNSDECNQIVTRMKNLKALPPVKLSRGDDWRALDAGDLSIAPFITELLHSGDNPSWSYFLDQDKFPLLQKLSCFNMHMVGNTQITTTHPLLTSLSLCWGVAGFMGVPIGMNRRNLSQILNACPNLESLELSGGLHRSLEPAFESAFKLNPNRYLKDLKIGCNFLKVDDLDRILDAYRDIQSLELIGYGSLEGLFLSRMDGDFLYLESVHFLKCELTIEDYLSLLCAAPKLKDLNIVLGTISGQLDMERVSDLRFEAMRKFSLQAPQIELLPLVERMPNLDELYLVGCDVKKTQVDVPEAYIHLKKLWITGKSHLDGHYLNAILTNAKGLEEITWEDSTCPWMFDKLEEGALSELKNVHIQNVSSSYAEIMSLFKKAVRLEKLFLPDFSFVEDDIEKLALAEHSLPVLRVFEERKLKPSELLLIIKAASQLERLDVPFEHLSVFSELPDGYLPKLEIVSCPEIVTFDDIIASMPGLQRVAPNLQLSTRMLEAKVT